MLYLPEASCAFTKTREMPCWLAPPLSLSLSLSPFTHLPPSPQHKQSDEPPIEVVPSTTSIEATSKKKFVFRIVTAQGAEYLLQADDAPSFSNWVAAIQRMNIGQTEMSTPQRLDSSNRLAPNSPLMQRRSSSPQPLTQKTKKKGLYSLHLPLPPSLSLSLPLSLSLYSLQYLPLPLSLYMTNYFT